MYHSDERLDALADSGVSYAHRANHLMRYQFAADVLNRHFSQKINLLDAACGLGYGSHLLAMGCRATVTGIDIDSGAVASAQKKYATTSLSFFTGDLTQKNTFKQKYHAIVSFETLEHISAAKAKLIVGHFYQSLKPGGLVIASSPNRYVTRVLELAGIKNPFHPHEFYPEELYSIFTQVGFKDIRLYGQVFAFPPTFLLAAAKILPKSYFYPSCRFSPNLYLNTILIAKKP